MASPPTVEAKRGNLLRDLIGPAAAAGPTGNVELQAGQTLNVPLELLDPNPYQPRTHMDEPKLRETMASIESQGQLQPITVRRVGERYQILAGHRRTECFRRLLAAATDDDARRRYSTIRAELREATDYEMLLLAFTENMHREELSPLDAAASLLRMQDFNPQLKTAKDLAEATGLQVERVKRLLRLSEAPEVIKTAVSGILVPVAEKGDAPEQAERRERRSLDLAHALELKRLHEHLVKQATASLKPGADDKKIRRATEAVDERVERIIARALREMWGHRRTESFVEDLMAGREREADGDANAPRATAPAFRNDAKQLVVYHGRLASLTEAERTALRTVLEPIWRAACEGAEASGQR